VTTAVGASVKRKEASAKANGTARYADDLTFPGMLHARTIRSTVARGRLNGWKLETDPAGLTIVDYRDIPGRNIVALIVDDQPCLVEQEIRHAAEPLLLVAHESREALLGIRLVLDEVAEEPTFDPLASSVVFKDILIEKGNSTGASPRPTWWWRVNTGLVTRSTYISKRTPSSPSRRMAGSRCTARSSAPTTCTRR
jgi:CO/xanthine dehydrogenase Mo-binding subunit